MKGSQFVSRFMRSAVFHSVRRCYSNSMSRSISHFVSKSRSQSAEGSTEKREDRLSVIEIPLQS